MICKTKSTNNQSIGNDHRIRNSAKCILDDRMNDLPVFPATMKWKNQVSLQNSIIDLTEDEDTVIADDHNDRYCVIDLTAPDVSDEKICPVRHERCPTSLSKRQFTTACSPGLPPLQQKISFQNIEIKHQEIMNSCPIKWVPVPAPAECDTRAKFAFTESTTSRCLQQFDIIPSLPSTTQVEEGQEMRGIQQVPTSLIPPNEGLKDHRSEIRRIASNLPNCEIIASNDTSPKFQIHSSIKNAVITPLALRPTANMRRSFNHVLLGNASFEARHDEVIDALPNGWKHSDFPFVIDDTLCSTEIELAYLIEESRNCQQVEDWNFVWTYASPQLRIQLRRLTLVRQGNSADFERLRLELRRHLLKGIRRPFMREIMTEIRRKILREEEMTCLPTFKQILPREIVQTYPPVVQQDNVLKRKMAEASESRKRTTLTSLASQTTRKQNLHKPLTDICNGNIVQKLSNEATSLKPAGTNLCSQHPTDIVLPRSSVLTEEEQEVAWLGEESILDHPNPQAFEYEFVVAHASCKLKVMLPSRSCRWLCRVVRFHNSKVRREFVRFRDQVRACLYGGFRRPETKDFLPSEHIPLPFWTLTEMAYSRAFPS